MADIDNIGQELLEALEIQYRGNIASARANVRVYLENPAGIGEHPDVVQAIDCLLYTSPSPRDRG